MEFFKRYNYMMATTFIVVVAISIGLFYIQFSFQYEQHLNHISTEFEERALNLDATMKATVDHLQALQILATSYLATHSSLASPSALFSQLEFFPQDNFYALDHVKPPFNEKIAGNLTGLGTLTNRAPNFYREIEMALALNPIFQSVFHNIPNIAWAYYTSKQEFINLYPWVASQDFKFKKETHTHEFFTKGLPENNPTRQAFWTSAYIDEAGKGLMVTYSVPVYDKDTFLGTISLDFTLDILNTFVKNFTRAETTLFLVNQNRQLLAHPTLVSSQNKVVKTSQAALPNNLLTQLFQLPSKEIHRIEANLLLYRNLTNVPWQLIALTPTSEIALRTLSDTSWGLAILLPGLILMLIVSYRMTHKEFIIPASLLVKHLENENQGLSMPIPTQVPAPWQPWFNSVTQIFRENHKLVHQLQESFEALQESESRLRQFLEAIPVGILVVDANYQPYYMNQATQRILGQDSASYFTNNSYPAARQPLWRALQGESSHVDDMEVQQGQQRIPIEVWGTPIFNERGKLTYAIAAFQDISERLHREKAEREREAAQAVNQMIMASLKYAKGIQSSLLPNLKHFKAYLPQSFFIWLPRDVVGGDIIYAESFLDGFLLVVMDCTGHGVPGAFMTMVASTCLRRVTREENCHNPGEILRRLSFLVKTSLQQDKEYSTSDDGLEAAACLIKSHEQCLIFAGAKLPLYYLEDGQFQMIKGDKQRLGYRKSDVNFTFTNHRLPLKEGLSYYLATDGLLDQVGGTKRLPFGKKRLGEVLLENCHLSFEEQAVKLTEAFKEYRGEHECLDDVTVVGFGF